MKLPTDKTKHILIISILLFLAATGGYAAGFYIINDKMEELDKAVSDLKAEELQSQNLTTIVSLLQQTDGQRSLFNTLFIGENDVISFLNTIEQMALDKGLEFQIGQADRRPIADVPIDQITLDLSAAGTWSDIYGYFYDLSRIETDITFGNISFNRLDTSDDSEQGEIVDQWRASFRIITMQEIHDEN